MQKYLFILQIFLFIFSCESKKIADEKQLDTLRQLHTSDTGITTDGILLQLNPQMGGEYVFESRLEQKILQKLDTLSSETKHNQRIVYFINFKEKDSLNNLVFEVKFKSIEQNITAQGLSVKANTNIKSKDPTPLEVFYSTLVDKDFLVKVNKQGQNIVLLGIDTLINKVIDQMLRRKEFQGVEKSLLSQIVGSFFNQNELRKGFEKIFEIYPKEPINIGTTWTISKFVNDPIPAIIVNKFTLKSIQNDSLLIDLISKVEFQKEKTKEGEPKLIELMGKQNGNLVVNKLTGLINKSELKQQIRIVYQIPPSTQTNNKAVKMVTNVTTVFNLSVKEISK